MRASVAVAVGVAVVATLLAATALAAPPPAPRAWLGTFEPATTVATCADCKDARVVPSAGSVRVLPPGEGDPPADGDVVVVSPLVGLALPAKLAAGKIALSWFAIDTREGATGVLVLPAATAIRFVATTAADVLAIKDGLVRA